ncbi:MAG: hypothetical protein NWR72_15505 [Bacteroidia bacterium]|nr:hypothetical protein [Bacteroidia bacterium]
MNTTSKLIFSMLLLGLLFASCDKQNIDEIIPESPVFQTDTIDVNPYVKSLQSVNQDSLKLDCISIPLPIDFLQASGNTVTVNTEAELDSVSLLPDSLVDFVYPFDGYIGTSVVTFQQVEDFIPALITCGSIVIDSTFNCSNQLPHVLLFFNALNIFTLNRYVYEINYPVTLVVNGTQVVLNQDSDYLPAIGGSPSNLPPTDLVYPITITQFGRDIVLNSDNDVCAFYQTLDEPCANKPEHIQFFFNEGPGRPINCTYFIDYPVGIVSDGDTLQIQTRDEYLTELNSSPNAYNDIELLYPVTATEFNNGQQIIFGSGSDICQYYNNCQ